jgi:putative restriction endonuclease
LKKKVHRRPPVSLPDFVDAFSALHRDEKNGGAPHKPILLLSVLHEYETGRIRDNRVFITPELTHLFSVFWNRLVTTNHTQGFALPFYHLTGEAGGWWRLIAKPECEFWIQNAGSMRSFGNLSSAVAHAEIDPNLSAFCLEKTSRAVLRQTLFETYFPLAKTDAADIQDDDYLNKLKSEIVEESASEYGAKMLNLKTNLEPEIYQVEVFNRGTIFRREVVKLYDETCCISGLRVSAPFTITMVDACHIEPFAKNFNNTLTNGIALAPNLHRAFDRGLLSVDDDYRVILSKNFKENEDSPFAFRQFEGQRIRLPRDARFLPSKAAFAGHREFHRSRLFNS